MGNLDTSLYWTPHNILSHNAMFNMVVGGRGTGKTYGSLHHCVKKYLRSGRGFIYMRRYDTDLEKREKLLSGISREFPKHEFMVNGYRLLVRHKKKQGDKKERRWDTMGYCVPLSRGLSDKSIPFDDIDTIIFDEFIIAKGVQRYLRNEVELFIDYYNTVDRYNDRVRVVFLANAVSINNPYFTYWRINIRKRDAGKVRMFSGDYVAVERLYSKRFTDQVDQTRFGQMIKDTPYYDYAVSNEFRDDDGRFIAQKPSRARFHSAYAFDGESFALWSDLANGVYYVTKKTPKDATPYALTRDDMTPNTMMIERSSRHLKGVMRLYMQGCVYFDSTASRSLFYDIMDYLNLR